MSVGPTMLFDKSAIQLLNAGEADWMNLYFRGVLTPSHLSTSKVSSRRAQKARGALKSLNDVVATVDAVLGAQGNGFRWLNATVIPPEDTGAIRDDVGPSRPPAEHRFQPRNSGRPKGARNKVGEAFLEALYQDFKNNGKAAIRNCRLRKPEGKPKRVHQSSPHSGPIDFLCGYALDARYRGPSA